MRVFKHPLAVAGIAAAMIAGYGGTASAAEPASSCVPLGGLQQRIVDRADQGPGPLRAYLYTTKFVYGVGAEDVAPQLDKWRARAKCARTTAEAEKKSDAPVVAVAPAPF